MHQQYIKAQDRDMFRYGRHATKLGGRSPNFHSSSNKGQTKSHMEFYGSRSLPQSHQGGPSACHPFIPKARLAIRKEGRTSKKDLCTFLCSNSQTGNLESLGGDLITKPLKKSMTLISPRHICVRIRFPTKRKSWFPLLSPPHPIPKRVHQHPDATARHTRRRLTAAHEHGADPEDHHRGQGHGHLGARGALLRPKTGFGGFGGGGLGLRGGRPRGCPSGLRPKQPKRTPVLKSMMFRVCFVLSLP